MVGGTNVPAAGSGWNRSQRKRTRPSPSMSAIQRSSLSFASASITGPTWVDGVARVAELELAGRPRDHLDDAIGNVLLHA